MKPDIHPTNHPVLYVDSAADEEWISRSTQTVPWCRPRPGVAANGLKSITQQSRPSTVAVPRNL